VNFFTYKEYWRRGQQLYNLYEQTGEVEALESALSDLRFAAQLVRDTEVPDRHNVFGQYAAACRSVAENSPDQAAKRAFLDEAVTAFLEALKTANEEMRETPFLLCDLAASLLERNGTEPEDDLANAVEICQGAIVLHAKWREGRPTPPDDDYGYFFLLLGDIHWQIYRRTVKKNTGSREERERDCNLRLEQFANACRQAVAFLLPGSITSAEAHLQLARGLLASYRRSLRATELEEAISLLEALPGDVNEQAGPQIWAIAHRRNALLASALLLRNRLYDLDLMQMSSDPGRAGDLTAAVLRPDLTGHRIPPRNASIPAILTMVDGWLSKLDPSLWPGEDEDGAPVFLDSETAVQSAIAAVKQMEYLCQMIPPDFPFAAACFARLSTAYLYNRHWASSAGKDSVDAEAAVAAAEKAVEQAEPDDAPMCWRALASARRGAAQAAYGEGDRDHAQAEEQAADRAAEAAIVGGLEHDLESALEAAVEWLDAAFTRQDWLAADRAATYLNQIVEKALVARRVDFAVWMQRIGESNLRPSIDLITGQLSISDFISGHLRQASSEFKEFQVGRRGRGWVRHVQGCSAKAAYSRARLGDPSGAAVILERGLARLFTADYPSAYSTQAPAPPVEDLPLDIDGIRTEAAAGDRDIVYLAATAHGGMAVRIPTCRDEPPETLWLDDLNDDFLQRLFYGTVGREWGFIPGPDTSWEMPGWIRVYYAYKAFSDGGSGQDMFKMWCDAIDGVAAALWPVLMGPLQEKFSRQRGAVLIPAGALRLLPLHAAWTKRNAAGSGRRYAGDRDSKGVGPLSYAPNAAALSRSRPQAEREASSALVVANPASPDAAPLPFAEVERDLVTAFFPNSHALTGAAAVAVRVNFGHYAIAHLACHAASNYYEPLKSGVLMQDGEWLTVSDLLAVRSRHRLVVLSACEAAVTGRSLPEELIGLADALALGGAAAVIAPLWRVDDISTALLMARFYDLWLRQGESPCNAFHDAQAWLRDATIAEKRAWLKTLGQEWPEVEGTLGKLRLAFVGLPENARAHSHPYYWAGFLYVGH
jgi:CHAT domain-containing protein